MKRMYRLVAVNPALLGLDIKNGDIVIELYSLLVIGKDIGLYLVTKNNSIIFCRYKEIEEFAADQQEAARLMFELQQEIYE